MGVDDVETLAARDVDDLGGERERVEIVSELRVGRRLDAVEGDAVVAAVETARRRVAEHVHAVTAARERGRDLGGDDAAAPEGRETRDADREAWRHGRSSWSVVGNGSAARRSRTRRLSVAGPTRAASDGHP